MTITETYCTECDGVVQDTPNFCPECGAEDPWDERPSYEFDESDLPVVFSYETYNDTYGLWRSFVESHFGAYELNGSDIAGIPEEFPRMKYCVHDLWFKVTKGYELEGPFTSREEAKEA